MSLRLYLAPAAAVLSLTTGCKVNPLDPSSGQSTGTGTGTGGPSVPVASGFLTAADLTPGTALAPTLPQDLLGYVQTAPFLYANPPPSVARKTCIDQATDTVPLQATATGLTFNATLDVAACTTTLANAGAAPMSYRITSSQLKIALTLNCQGGGAIAGFNGRKYSDLRAFTLGELCPQASLQWETAWSTNATYSVAGAGGVVKTGTFANRIVTYQGSDNLGFCQMITINGLLRRANGCMSIYHMTGSDTPTPGAATAQEFYLKLTATGIAQEASATALWPLSGTVNVVANNWTGTITYQGTQVGPIATLASPGGTPVTTRLTPPAP